jgi:glycine dehydrogenase
MTQPSHIADASATTLSQAGAGPAPASDAFCDRHLGPREGDLAAMLAEVGYDSLDALIDATVPADIRLTKPLALPGLPEDGYAQGSEHALLEYLASIAAQNTVATSMIGQGYYGTITPPVLLRNLLEDPRWYTPYTPYQAEISQGRLEALLNFQTMVSDLVGLPLAGASLLDEATAAAEAMAMCFGIARRKKTRFLVADDVHPQTLAVIQTRAWSMGIEVEIVDFRISNVDCPEGDATTESRIENRKSKIIDDSVCGVLVQYPNTYGEIHDYRQLADAAHEAGALVVAATDLLACCLIEPPGEWGADIAVGSSQRFGVPMGYGGPHAAFLATHEKHARKMPGRIIGVSKDAHGNLAYRMAIQTREQHIKRDKATSNICTAQVLLAITAGMYAVWHGPEGLKRIARRVHGYTSALAEALRDAGLERVNETWFDTLSVRVEDADAALAAAREKNINLRRIDEATIGMALDQTTTPEEIDALIEALTGETSGGGSASQATRLNDAPESTVENRASPILQHPVFNTYHSEHEMLRYLNRLIGQDIGLDRSMIPLGSCTMKLNAAVEMIPVTWPGFADLHPYCPPEQAKGYRKLFEDLEAWLAACTGFAAVSLQPNAGSQGEYAGLLAIKRYHDTRAQRGDGGDRNICLIPTSAHGTNPASAVIAGMKVVPVGCRDNGDIDLDDLRAKAKEHADALAALMITYPSTHGVFEETVIDACRIVHDHGGLVYMDGANMNAQLGLTTPGKTASGGIGADVCHLNLHKTFCIPHGGGGPGMGPIACTEALAPYLPGDPVHISNIKSEISNNAHLTSDISYSVSAAPFGSPMILPISWAYIALMGARGLTEATRYAILNANYMAKRLAPHYPVLFTGRQGTCAHEFIIDCRAFEKSAQVTVEDIAKRLMDFGIHAPTMSWPVAGTMMVEPTESEPRAELNRVCDALIAIRQEVAAIERGELDAHDNPLKNAPHTAAHVTADAWPHTYGREQAAYPVPALRQPGAKYWPPVGRIDNPYGDRNLICACPPMDAFSEA